MANVVSITAHQEKIVARYGGKEFTARMQEFPDGYHNLGYWEPNGVTRLEASRNLIMETARALKIPAQGKILDVGCGVGIGTIEIAREASDIQMIGVDITPDNIDYAISQLAPNDNVEFMPMSATSLAFPPDFFDGIMAVDCAIHFDDRVQFFKEAYRVLKPGGILSVTDTLITKDVYRRFWKYLAGKMLSSWCVPESNVLGINECRDQLKSIGFHNASIVSIADKTLQPVCIYFTSYTKFINGVKIEGFFKSIEAYLIFSIMKYATKKGMIDYVSIVAEK